MKLLLLILTTPFLIGQTSFDVKLKEYLNEKLNSYQKIEFQVIQMPSQYSKIELNQDKNLRLTNNYAYVPVKVYDKNNNVSASLITVRVKLFKTVFVAARTIKKEEEIFPDMFLEKVIDVSLIDGTTISDYNELISCRSKGIIKEEAVLRREMIEAIPIINKGDKVVLHAFGNTIDVSMEGIARQDGCVGEIITIQSNGKLFKARVIDKINLKLVE